jgi:CheY-like chemotaxis protein
VDDDTVFHEYIELLMSSAARVIPARDGKLGIEVARQTLPDLIFMDLRMPVLDGFSAVRALKEDLTTSHIPVIAVTAHGVEEIRSRAMSVGVSGIVTKPVDTTLLTEEVQRLLGQTAR